MKETLSEKTLKQLLFLQQEEVNSAEIYRRLGKRVLRKDEKNGKIILDIASDETEHARTWEKYTGVSLRPNKLRVFWFSFISIVLGFTFAVKYLERGENSGIDQYSHIVNEIPEAEKIISEENFHELSLIEMMDEDRLKYLGSIVLGLNDAMVEMTGALAGYTLAMQSTKLISLAGLITGISAILSMAASEYQSAVADNNPNAVKAAAYTGFTYLVTVVLLIAPYLLLPDNMYLQALFCMLIIVVAIIAVFNYYISVAQDIPFRKRFLQMLAISLGVAAVSFVLGMVVKEALGVDI